MARIVVTAFGADRPGIVAAVTGVLMDHGGNLEDTSMTILQGQFAMVLVVSVPEGEQPADLEAALAREGDQLGLTVVVRPLTDHQAAPPTPGSTWALSLYGADRPGIVHRVTRLLADHGVNVVDLSTRVVGDPDDPAYVMLLELVVPDSDDADRVAAELEGVAADLGVEIHLRPDDADVL